MALVGMLSTSADRSGLRRMLKIDGGCRQEILVSGKILTGGILLTGTGTSGTIFVVLTLRLLKVPYFQSVSSFGHSPLSRLQG